MAFDVEIEKHFSPRFQKFFRRYQVSSILKKCNACKEQGFSVITLVQYLFCLVSGEPADIFAAAYKKLQLFLQKLLEGFIARKEGIYAQLVAFLTSLLADMQRFLNFERVIGTIAIKNRGQSMCYFIYSAETENVFDRYF